MEYVFDIRVINYVNEDGNSVLYSIIFISLFISVDHHTLTNIDLFFGNWISFKFS